MGFLDFFKNLFGKKETPLTSPGETPSPSQSVRPDGQFMTPQSQPTTQTTPASTPPSTPPGEKPTA